MDRREEPAATDWRTRLFVIIFESDTAAGKTFDVALILTILLSLVVMMLESVAGFRQEYGVGLRIAEWVFTGMFTIEYVLRLICVRSPGHYARSFFGVIDLLSILPTYVSLLIPGAHYLAVIRTLRILRVFRVLKLAHYVKETDILLKALRASRRKITVFLFAVLTMVVVIGSVMYLVEGPKNGFTSIPRGVYWAVVTLTTVGYGDISPQTSLGQALAMVVMIMGYGIIAVPTGIVSVELAQAQGTRPSVSGQACPDCSAEGHETDARHCKFCGAHL